MNNDMAVVGFLSWRAARVPYLEVFLNRACKYVMHSRVMGGGVRALGGWGRRPKALAAQALACKKGLPFITIEDGFLRSAGRNDAPLSIVVDDLGIYFDAHRPSRLEQLVHGKLNAEEVKRAQALIEAWRLAGVSKYNHAPEFPTLLDERYVLVVDQTNGDASVVYGNADEHSFQRMLNAALLENPDCKVVVKCHPDTAKGKKRGYFDPEAIVDNSRVHCVTTDCHAVGLLASAEAVYVVTSQMGFEALIWGKKVRTFGMPFYAGWGLTEDELPAPARRRAVGLEQLIHAALINYARYINPLTGQRCEVEDALRHLALQRQLQQQLPSRLHAVGFSKWKQPILRGFVKGSEITFHRRLENVPKGATVLRWGMPSVIPKRRDLKFVTVEDGFLRSVGLGAQLIRPVSWVFDRSGIYYDATTASDLEQLLSHAEFDSTVLSRASQLRELIVKEGLTKYNVGAGKWKRPYGARKVVLVAGQVETDASLRFGALGIRTNRALLQAVQAELPDAYIVYKPHPDVMSGLRGDREAEKALASFCDELVVNFPTHQLIEAVDSVHVLTSLTGFEALLRGKSVTVHGMPFYAGWGLTDDRWELPRRRRVLSLDMLVAGALILYPRYVLRDGRNGFATPEQAVDHMLSWRNESAPVGARLLQRWMQPLLRRWSRWREAAGGADTPWGGDSGGAGHARGESGGRHRPVPEAEQ